METTKVTTQGKCPIIMNSVLTVLPYRKAAEYEFGFSGITELLEAAAGGSLANRIGRDLLLTSHWKLTR